VHWVYEYIGKPYVKGSFGPDSFDCWGLVWTVYKNRFEIELPRFLFVDNQSALDIRRAMKENARQYEELAQPEEGCIVGIGQGRELSHVGIWIESDGGLVLHATAPRVLAQSLKALRLAGFQKIQFYKHAQYHRNFKSV
jgi:cell wall-associated NlpC family hydrolase